MPSGADPGGRWGSSRDSPALPGSHLSGKSSQVVQFPPSPVLTSAVNQVELFNFRRPRFSPQRWIGTGAARGTPLLVKSHRGRPPIRCVNVSDATTPGAGRARLRWIHVGDCEVEDA